MKKDEIIKITDEWLKSVPDIKAKIRLIDDSLKDNTFDTDTIDKVKHERNRLRNRLSRIIKAIGTLDEENQRIICYRYFDGLTYNIIGRTAGVKGQTVSRRIEKCLLLVGRKMFGLEDELLDELSGVFN